MTMWRIIFFTPVLFSVLAMIYLSSRVCRFGAVRSVSGRLRRWALGFGIVLGLFLACGHLLGVVNAVICLLHFALIWLACDLASFIVRKTLRQPASQRYHAGSAAVLLSVLALSAGWYLGHHVWRTDYAFETEKAVKPLRVVMFADSHTGTTFHADGFARHAAAMQQAEPDVVIVSGDFVDDETTREDMAATCRTLGAMKTAHGVYFVFGNHDKSYYGAQRRGYSAADLAAELEKNGVHVLTDEAVLVADSFYVIGRRDFSVENEQGGRRASMAELVRDLDKGKYMIVADHQPADCARQEEAGVDLVLSGHTHGGQLFPFNQVGKWIGANDLVYGHEKRGGTDFVVTSGISDWAIKFKTGTKSEFVVIDVKGKGKAETQASE